MNKLNLQFLRRAIRLAAPFWFSKQRRQARWLLFLLILLLLGYTEFAVLFNQQSGEFTSALAAREGPRFWRSIRFFFVLLVIGVPIDAYYYFVRDTLALKWRRWLTERFLERYFTGRGYYHLLGNSAIDNPDQRITDDIYSFTQQSLTFVLVLANGLLQLAAFGRVLWTISTYLVGFLFLYAAVLTAATFGIFGQRMVSLHSVQRRREADFRFGLVRIRENAEAIALYHGERQERNRLQEVFAKLFANATDIIRWSLFLNFAYYGNSFLALVLPTLIVAPRVLSGELEVGSIVQATGAFSAILSALTLLLDNLDDLSRFAASVGRLEALQQSLPHHQSRSGRATPTPSGAGESKPATLEPVISESVILEKNSYRNTTIVTEECAELSFENVTLNTPNNERTLIKALTLAVPQGKGLMIVGPSGLGKSSLLRAIAGLWDSGEGILKRPKADDMLFLPQHAYMVAGSLRVQLNYPNLDRSVSDDELREVLKRVNLDGLVDRCRGFDAKFDFEKILSVGERQRVAFARVLLKSPPYALLDESTSALDHENETELYGLLTGSSTTLVSVSHHLTLVKYHAQVLELKVNGEWQLHAADTFQATGNLG